MIDLIERLEDLHKQATVERSHYYTGKCIRDAIEEIKMLRGMLGDITRAAADKNGEIAMLKHRIQQLSN